VGINDDWGEAWEICLKKKIAFGAMLIPNLILAGLACRIAHAEDEPTFTIEFHDGKVEPLRLEVPANKRFKLELRNSGAAPAEFESNELRKEKVVAPNSSAILVFKTLDPGEYKFLDDFHPDASAAVLIAK
jgi:hypothetical protein